MLFNFLLILTFFLIFLITNSLKNISKEKKNKIFLLLVFTISTVLMSIRDYSVGTDTITYVDLFHFFAREKWNITIIGGIYEPLYLVLNILLSYISNNPRVLIVVTSVFINYAFYSFIKNNSKNYFLSVAIFTELMFFYTAMNTIRQYMAIAILLLAFKYVKEKKIFTYSFFVLIAFLFHSTALIGILIYPMFNAKFSHSRAFAIIVLAIISSIFISKIVNNYYNILGKINYYDYRIGQKNIANLLYTIVYGSMYLLGAVLTNNQKEKNNYTGFYLYTFVLATAFNLIAINMNVLIRIATYFTVFSIASLPNVIEENIKPVKYSYVANFLVVIILMTYSSIVISYRPEWNTAFDYKPFFNNEITLNE